MIAGSAARFSHNSRSQFQPSIQSGREDLNLRPLGPEPSALIQAELRPVLSCPQALPYGNDMGLIVNRIRASVIATLASSKNRQWDGRLARFSSRNQRIQFRIEELTILLMVLP